MKIRVFVLVALWGVLSACHRGASTRHGKGDRYAVLAGGSGETVEPNFFVEDLKGFQKQLVDRGWHVRAVVGPKDGLLPGALRATNANILAGVRESLRAAAPGQEALILFHAHGRERETYWGQRSHSIVTEDKDASGNDPGLDLDAIEPDLKQAKARGVKVSLVDLSCYSGSSQELQGTVCTVSLAASNYVSLCSGREEERGFNSRFFKLPHPDTPLTLEDQFMESRRFDHKSINLAQISSRKTPGLKGWEGFLLRADPLDTFDELKEFKNGTKVFDPKQLLTELDTWSIGLTRKNEYKVIRAEIAQRLSRALALRATLESKMSAIAQDYDGAQLDVDVVGRGPMKLGSAYLAEMLEAVKTGHAPEGFTDVQRNLAGALKPLVEELAKRFEQPLKAFRARREEFDQLTEQFAQSADDLFEVERVVYDLQPQDAASNPCREFEL